MSLKVTDHALVRFLDRAGGLDVEGLRGRLAGSLDRAALVAGRLGQRRYTVTADGLRYVVEDGHVVTVLDGDMVRGRPEPRT